MEDDAVKLGEEIKDETTVYDARQSIKVRKPPEYLDDMRHSDPQGTIDYIYERKEYYKDLSNKYLKHCRMQQQKIMKISQDYDAEKQQASSYKKAALKWKQISQKELAMKNWWKIACCATGVGLIITLAIMMIVTQLMSISNPRHTDGKVPVSGNMVQTPTRVLSSVNIMNGTKQGSGTIISKGKDSAYLLTVAHNFKGVIGGPFWVYYPDGTYTKATLLAIDRERDLALAKVDASSVIANSYVPEELIRGSTLSGCGYTDGQGPNYRTLICDTHSRSDNNRWLWEMRVESGPFWNGDSGGGVFMDDACIGVTSHRNVNDSKKLYAVPLNDVLEFLRANATDYVACGDWRVAPPIRVSDSDEPPLWAPKSNIPINVPDPRDRAIKDLQAEIVMIKDKIGVRPVVQEPPKKGELLKKPSEVPDK